MVDGFETYHVMNPHDDGIGLDEYVDWLIEAGYPIQRIGDFGRVVAAVRDRPACPAGSTAPALGAAGIAGAVAQFQGFAALRADPRLLGADRSVPCCGARSENRPRQRHPARLGADHHQIRHRLATARTALDLGYEKHDPAGAGTGNIRNGTRAKTVLTETTGPVEIEVPRDRAGTFEPQIVKKRQRRLSGVDEVVLSLYAKGLTTGEISAHFAEIYGASVSQGDDQRGSPTR